MIEELKRVLDALGDLSGIGLWILAGFVGYKSVIYLSTTGAVVFILKLAIEKTHDILTRPKRRVETVWSHNGGYFPEESKRILEDVLNSVFSNDVHYTTEARKLKEAWDIYLQNKGE